MPSHHVLDVKEAFRRHLVQQGDLVSEAPYQSAQKLALSSPLPAAMAGFVAYI